ncbi:MAG TPA: hypothetical protein VJV79_22920 [Polyangiaceae bacterium]|nr:hypothetical protein [Polyangiaceae bacterium]
MFCALDPRPDARCLGSKAFCDAAVLVSCNRGYATAHYNCAVGEAPVFPIALTPGTPGACVELSSGGRCVSDARPDPICQTGPVYYSQCSGNDRIHCVEHYVVQRSSCGSSEVCRQGSRDANCLLPGSPDPDCSAYDAVSSFCVSNTLVQCSGRYRTSEEPCLGGEECHATSPFSAACEIFPD